jgi:hypothetical protein
MKTINAYQTTDGSLFASAYEAEKHEVLLSIRNVMEEYLDSSLNTYSGSAHKSICRNTIINWELWKQQNEITPE